MKRLKLNGFTRYTLSATHKPEGLAEQMERLLFPETEIEIHEQDDAERETAIATLKEVVAELVDLSASFMAPTLSDSMIERVREVANETEMDVLNYWQGRITPYTDGRDCDIYEGIKQLALLPGKGESVQNWWMVTFSASLKDVYDHKQRARISNTHYLTDNRNTGKPTPSGKVIKDVFARVLRSFVAERPTIAEIARHESAHAKHGEKARLTAIGHTYMAISRFADWLVDNIDADEDGESIDLSVLTLHEINKEVKKSGVCYEQDCGDIYPLPRMREIIQDSEKEGEVIVPCKSCNTWVKGYSFFNVCPHHYPGAYSFHLPTGWNKEDKWETKVTQRLAPDIPDYGAEAMITRLALLNNTTPQTHQRVPVGR